MIQRLRTVTVNERGQIVIPEEIRKDFGIGKNTTLAMIEREGEIVLRKESTVIAEIGEDKFWRALTKEAMKKAWEKEDKIWDKIYRGEVK
jgi:AbrB family looped-hinge helix DNA binding protein